MGPSFLVLILASFGNMVVRSWCIIAFDIIPPGVILQREYLGKHHEGDVKPVPVLPYSSSTPNHPNIFFSQRRLPYLNTPHIAIVKHGSAPSRPDIQHRIPGQPIPSIPVKSSRHSRRSSNHALIRTSEGLQAVAAMYRVRMRDILYMG